MRLTPESCVQLKELWSDEALIVHRCSSKKDPAVLVVFVHGFGGSRYGRRSTWGQLPSFVLEDFDDCDVGLYRYRTALGRIMVLRAMSLRHEAQALADVLRDSQPYAKIILIGHSLGGLHCLGAICHLMTTSQIGVARRIAGLLLLSTPQLGSRNVRFWLTLLSAEARGLAVHSDYVETIQETLINHVSLDERSPDGKDVVIPTWALLAGRDIWVDRVSAGIGIAADRKTIVDRSHTRIVKPTSKSDDCYMWINKRLRSILDMPPQSHRSNRDDKATEVRSRQRVPPGSLRICLAMGIIAADADEQHCRAYLARLAELLVQTDFRFVYSGTGGNLATEFCNALVTAGIDAEQRIFSLIAAEYDNLQLQSSLPSPVRERLHNPIGREIRYAGETREIRRHEMVDVSDFLIIMGGRNAISHMFQLSIRRRIPGLLLHFSGGIAKRALLDDGSAEACLRIFADCCGEEGMTLINRINATSATPDQRAVSTLELLRLYDRNRTRRD